jgi:DNA polymerase (family X)
VSGRAEEATALRRASETVAARSDQELEAALRGAHASLSGVDAQSLAVLREAAATPGRPVVNRAIATLPADLRRLHAVSGLSLGDLAQLYRSLGTLTRGDLATAVDEGLLQRVPAFGSEKAALLVAALEHLRADVARIPLGRAFVLARAVVDALETRCPEVYLVTPVGSLRRFEPTVGDIEILAVADASRPIIDAFVQLPGVLRVVHRSVTKAIVELDRAPITLRVVPAEAAGLSLVHLTGSATHLAELRRHAAARDLTLTSAGLTTREGLPVAESLTEGQVYDWLGLPFIAPELRSGWGEVGAAADGRLPRLVRRADIRGDLHMHSTWSDGRDPIEVMVRVAQELGYEYVAITDHSQSSSAARGLTVDALRRQMDEIETVRRMIPGITVLHGSEVDILPDGSLDFPDDVLEELDIVLASLHDDAGHDGRRLTARYCRAMRNPRVSILTHLTNRLVGHRDGYDLDFDAIFETAVETGTVLEIDGAPVHLDMDGAIARRAVAAGVTLSINSDCHRAELLDQQMRFGVATARRGWVEADQVLNTLPLYEVAAVLAGKRK